MGYYRLMLAMLVLASHLYYRGFDYGQSAVVCFFLISGFVMTKLLDSHYGDIKQASLFYVDRAARIFPQYLVYCAATIALISATTVKNDWTSACTPGMLAGNISLLMLYEPGSNPIWKCTLIPASWSLSLEWAFYLMVPFIANSRSKAIFLFAAAFSLHTYIMAYLGIIDTDWNGFRHISGTLFMFLVGVSFAREGTFWKAYRGFIWVGAVGLFGVLLIRNDLAQLRPNMEVLAGLIIGIPALGVAISTPAMRGESLSGNLSYGVFLNHYLIILLFQRFTGWESLSLTWKIVTVAAASLIVSAVTYAAVERPVMEWRRSLRKKREVRIEADSSASA
jgi:peptidoglycan/LPS O-acetylase OafA/YrhL